MLLISSCCILIICLTTLVLHNIQLCDASAGTTELHNDNEESMLTKLEVSGETDDDYGDYVDENEVSKQTRQRNQSTFDRVGIFYTWDRWEKWSKCSTSCVQIKKRKCIQRTKKSLNDTSIEERFYPDKGRIGCSGVLKRYRQCKEERCKPSKQRLRDEQCERFNSVPYRDVFYKWVGYEKEHDECMLFCRAVNSDLFTKMNQSVTDGTPCNRPAVYYTHFYRRQAVCVEGICRAIHSSGAIRPVTTRDSQLKCGSVLCKPVSAIFSATNLTEEYNFIAEIPRGAMNLSIRQGSQTENSLALKSRNKLFLINRDLKKVAENTFFNFSGVNFEFNQQKGLLMSRELITASMTLMYFLSNINNATTYVQYNYTIPISSAGVTEEEELQGIWNESGMPVNDTDSSYAHRVRERKRRRYIWKLLGFGECNRSCGPGTRTPIFRCVCARESSQGYYSPQRCASVEKPTFHDDIYNCNRGLCPAFWRPSKLRNCQCPAGSLIGQRTRQLECMQEQIKGNVELVSDNLCPVRENVPESCRCATSN